MLVRHGEYIPMGWTDRQTDGRTPHRYIMLSAGRIRRNNIDVQYFMILTYTLETVRLQ